MTRRPPRSTLFPTRRSSDLYLEALHRCGAPAWEERWPKTGATDRKSTRLNSSHVAISYAVFCLKKKKKMNQGVDILITMNEVMKRRIRKIKSKQNKILRG